jgi:hypothetical protein
MPLALTEASARCGVHHRSPARASVAANAIRRTIAPAASLGDVALLVSGMPQRLRQASSFIRVTIDAIAPAREAGSAAEV